MTQPVQLPFAGIQLHKQVAAFLSNDLHPTEGIVAALGAGANSIFPNFTTDGPNTDPGLCPRPFIIVASGGSKSLDRSGREHRVFLEIHDDEDQGDQRWPGIVTRVKQLLIYGVPPFKPATDGYVTNYVSGLHFDSESPLLPSETYQTTMIQMVLAAIALDRTSNKGYQG